MFNIKYFIGNSFDNIRYTQLNNTPMNIYRANFNAGLMFATNPDIINWYINDSNPFAIQNDFIKRATGINDVFTKMDPVNSETLLWNGTITVNRYTFNNPHDNMYFFANDSNIRALVIMGTQFYFHGSPEGMGNEIDIKSYVNLNETFIINRRTNQATFDIYVSYPGRPNGVVHSYTINHERFIEAASLFKKNQVTITEFKEHYIKGNIITKETKTIYTSIPFDNGWNVTVNGEGVETFRIGEALLGFDVEAGDSEIILSYIPEGFKVGSIISLSSVIVIIGSAFVHIRRSMV